LQIRIGVCLSLAADEIGDAQLQIGNEIVDAVLVYLAD